MSSGNKLSKGGKLFNIIFFFKKNKVLTGANENDKISEHTHFKYHHKLTLIQLRESQTEKCPRLNNSNVF